MRSHSLPGTFRLPNPRRRTIISNQAQQAKRLKKKLAPVRKSLELVDEISFPNQPMRQIRAVPSEYVEISVGKAMQQVLLGNLLKRFGRNQKGSVSPSVLLSILGGMIGFGLGTKLQFNVLSEYIAKELNVSTEQLSYLSYLCDPSLSRSYLSMLAMGGVGIFFGAGTGHLLGEAVGPKNGQE